MNQEKIGKFIANCRKQKNMTQLAIGKMEETCQTYLYLNHYVMN